LSWNPDGEKREECKKVIEGNAEALETLILEGPQKAMDRFHKKMIKDHYP